MLISSSHFISLVPAFSVQELERYLCGVFIPDALRYGGLGQEGLVTDMERKRNPGKSRK